MSFERMWRDLAPIGRSASSGGYFRQPWTSAEAELRSWFEAECGARGLRLETDGLGNTIAWWEVGEGPAVLTGSHLDSVLDGGAYDGPLGVVSALAALDELRERGAVPSRPLGIGVFMEEEGSRFGRACLGSRLALGATSWREARELRDRDGVALGEVADGSALDWRLTERIGCFVELHVEQGRDLVDQHAAVGVASGIWPHGRYRFDFTGEANHAGTTRMEDRRDPMLTFAMTALAANKQARLTGQRATFGRLDVAPNGTNAVPSRVTAWLDARGNSAEAVADLVAAITRQAGERAERDGTTLEVTAESVSGAVDFDPDLAQRLAGEHEGGDWPILPTAAGHDAGILSAAGIPTAMLFVRNPTGISHAPQEHAETPDCLAGVHALADSLERLLGESYLLSRALLPEGPRENVLVGIAQGRFTAVTPDAPEGPERERAELLPGLTIPGLANTHSHAFHRALRGRTQRERGTFWTWREQMYDVAARLTPEDYHRLALATYREMVAAGMTGVGEFHYLHHQPDGTAYADPNEMSHALLAAAREAGIRITLLDTCYLSSGFGAPPQGAQQRYHDGSAEAWAERVAALGDPGPGAALGAAIRSVRAVPADALTTVATAAAGRPLHVHLSEQVAENEACLAHHGCTPTRLLADHGVLGPLTTAVHATHLSAEDIALLGHSGTYAGFCPTTERDLGDGIGPAGALHRAGSPLSLGSDSHAVIDPFEEMRALETDERLATQERGHFTATELLTAATRHDSLGFPDAGTIAVGARADLVTLDTASARTAGTGADAHTVAFAATAADVISTMIEGRVVFTATDHAEIGRDLDTAIGRIWA